MGVLVRRSDDPPITRQLMDGLADLVDAMSIEGGTYSVDGDTIHVIQYWGYIHGARWYIVEVERSWTPVVWRGYMPLDPTALRGHEVEQ